MRLTRSLRRFTAVLLLAALALAQSSVTLAACDMDRQAMAQAMADGAMDCDCGGGEAGPQESVSNRCVAHCTAELQIAATVVAIIGTPPRAEAFVPPQRDPPAMAAKRHCPPRAGIPMRILLHAFLV
ncbi:MAG: hypothetical protein ACT4P9_05210 [Betaproteobacteria bacterium]